MVASLEQTFSQKGAFDQAAIDSVPLRRAKPWLDNAFTDYEVSAAVRKLANGKSAGEAQCPVEYYKVLEEDPTTRVYLREVVNAYWQSGSFPAVDIPSGPPPDLAEPTMTLAINHGWPIAFQQVNPKRPGTASWLRYEAYKHCTTTRAALEF